MNYTRLNDIDLDIVSITKDFPDNNSDALLYIRGSCEDTGHFTMIGQSETIGKLIMTAMIDQPAFATQVFNAVLNVCRENKNNKELIIKLLNEL